MSGENEMDQTAPDAAGNDERMWPMGAVTRRTGIGEHTLRAWERRFGFPTPHRLESGHRRYSTAQVQQLLLISRALGCGHRAGDVVPLTVPEIEELLRQTGVGEGVDTIGGTEDVVVEVVEACRRFDRDALVGILRHDASVLGMAAFLRERVAPLLEEIGEEWSRGGIEIRHEHFFSEVLEDELRLMRVPLQVSAGGRPVVLASLPNENHALGLQVAALAITVAGRAVRVLGPHLPSEEIVHAAEVLDAAAVGVSMSVFAQEEETARELEVIRKALPKVIEVWVGGAGSARLERLSGGIKRLPTLDDLDHAVKGLSG